MRLFLIILLCIIGLLIVLFAVAAVNAHRIKSEPISKKKKSSFTADEENLYAKRLSEMIKIPTISAKDGDDLTEFDRLHSVMEKQFPLVFAKLEKIEFSGSLLFKWKGKNGSDDAVLLMGHQDVVPADDSSWKHKPFSGDIADRCVHGRGAMDCKCTVMAEFSAVEELLEEGFEPESDIYLAASANEEIFGSGAPATVEYLKSKGVRLSAVMDEGGAIMSEILPGVDYPCAAIGIVEKGNTNIKITAKGAGGHSSTPARHSPLARLSSFVNEVEKKRPFKRKIDKPVEEMFSTVAPYANFPLRFLFGNIWLFKPLLTWLLPVVSSYGEAFVATTFAFTMCGGSSAPNVIPNEAYVICNLRPSIHQNCDESIKVLKKFADKYNLEITLLKGSDASNITDTKGEEFNNLKKCINEFYPDVFVTPFYMTGGTDCRNYELVSDNCLRFFPIRMTPKQLEAMHAVDENIGTDAVADGVKFYKYYLKNRKKDT